MSKYGGFKPESARRLIGVIDAAAIRKMPTGKCRATRPSLDARPKSFSLEVRFDTADGKGNKGFTTCRVAVPIRQWRREKIKAKTTKRGENLPSASNYKKRIGEAGSRALIRMSAVSGKRFVMFI